MSEKLGAFQRYLSMLSGELVENFYNTAHKECCLGHKGVPAPRAIQQLVTATGFPLSVYERHEK